MKYEVGRGLGGLGINITAAAMKTMTDDQIDAILAGMDPFSGTMIPGGTPSAMLDAATAEYKRRVAAGTWRKGTAPAGTPPAPKAGMKFSTILIIGIPLLLVGGMMLFRGRK